MLIYSIYPGMGRSPIIFFKTGRLHNNLFCPELGPDFLGKEFSHLTGMHEILINFQRNPGILVHESCAEFDLQDPGKLVISHRAQNNRLNGLSFQRYHHCLTGALES